jgi:prepilin signal peptidase PulO-like enzyme (type II secretory pathway)
MSEILILSGFFFLGAIFASLAGVLAGRLYTGAPIVFGRSRCDSCGEVLSVLDLVPLLSWALSLGRCRYCSSRVSFLSTAAELTLGLLFALAYMKLGLGASLALFLVALVLLLVLVLYDLAHSIIPPTFLWPFIGVALAFAYISWPSDIFLVLGQASAFAVFFALIHFLSGGRAMGLADTPLAFGLALIAGPFALAGFLFSFWIGAVIGISILLRTPKGSRMGIEVPFAPFLAAGFLLAYFSEWDPFSIGLVINSVLGG